MNASSPLQVNAREFNTGAERYSRTTLRQSQLAEAFEFLTQDCRRLVREPTTLDSWLRKSLRAILQGREAARFVATAKEDVINERTDDGLRLLTAIRGEICALRRVLSS